VVEELRSTARCVGAAAMGGGGFDVLDGVVTDHEH
jgi:hypothetical protein